MDDDLMDRCCADDGEPSTAPGGMPADGSTPVSLLPTQMCSEMSISVLAAHCLREINNYRRCEPYTEMYGMELFCRATVQGNQEARACVQHCFHEVVRDWLRRHPRMEVACRLESEERYVAQTFERFWRATASNQRLEFSRLAAALQYLRVCLNGAILDTLRSYARSREVTLPEPGVPQMEGSTDDGEVWDIFKTMLSSPRERRLAHLLFCCGLKPREIVYFCPPEWSNVQEIYRLRRDSLERLLRNAD